LRVCSLFFFFSSRRRHTRSKRDWSSDVCSSDLTHHFNVRERACIKTLWKEGDRWVEVSNTRENGLERYGDSLRAFWLPCCHLQGWWPVAPLHKQPPLVSAFALCSTAELVVMSAELELAT